MQIVCNVIIGKTLTLDELFGKMGYAAVFIGTGAGLPQFLGVPGENLSHVTHYYDEPHPFYRQDALVVGGGEARRDLARDVDRLVDRQATDAAEER